MKKSKHLFNLSCLFSLKTNALYTYTLCALFIIFVYILTENSNVSMYELVADPNELGGIAPYAGLVSTVGTMIFTATASVCFFSAYLINLITTEGKTWSLFLNCSGGFVLILLIDDLWQIHENIPLLLFGFDSDNRGMQNMGESVIFILLGLLFTIYLIRFRKLINRTENSTLVLAVLFFGLSTIIDIFLADISGHFILEEGFKLLGIVSLAIYYFQVGVQKIRQLLSSSSDRQESQKYSR